MLWPFDWRLRFHSPVSYWDPACFGRQVFVVELALDAALLGYLFGLIWVKRLFRPRGPR